ncbi:hypothetical protein JL720_2400 [Aureococcus anophagefferens]|nr:hypothetical protein JL720_2400 [Aureococcus anophagefferens]
MKLERELSTSERDALQASISEKLAEILGVACDPVLAEYTIVLVSNGKTMEELREAMNEMIGPDMSASLAAWLGEELAARRRAGRAGRRRGGDRRRPLATTRRGARGRRRRAAGEEGQGRRRRSAGGARALLLGPRPGPRRAARGKGRSRGSWGGSWGSWGGRGAWAAPANKSWVKPGKPNLDAPLRARRD